MAWKFNSDTPVYIQIERKICMDILNGKFPPNSQLPSVRQIAVEASVNPNTVQKALCELENRKIVYSRATIGRFVTDDMDIIENERTAVKERIVNEFCATAMSLGISKDEIISILSKEENL